MNYKTQAQIVAEINEQVREIRRELFVIHDQHETAEVYDAVARRVRAMTDVMRDLAYQLKTGGLS